ncbi:hypothetical protein [Chryseosolibacter indicus]|uniref:Uncharacterized protein n=1 Tax=Chryseosolibacter indicus TaxID=2782351 RepID=A0ABS5VUD9_9BACT|nr:hypothetical protein [Chryseosolibacter indicus]MBT1704450.1 hypothetical protein [Chryseosolibacter indicus]
MTEAELRRLWKDEYCDPGKAILTFDNVQVKFYENMFDHVFFESANRKFRDKSILSLNRLEKMLWIKDTLQDPTAVLKQGWDRDTKTYDNGRRVALVKDGYVVVIRFTGLLKASFVTAYELTDEEGNNNKILTSPDWIRDEQYVGKAQE